MGFLASFAAKGLGGWALYAVGAALLLAGFFYVQSLRADLRTAVEVQSRLEGTIETQNKTMEQLRADVERGHALSSKLTDNWEASRREGSELQKKFTQTIDGVTRSFKERIVKDPGDLESRINVATLSVLRCNEIASGDPVIASDSGNRYCPELIKKRTKK